MRSARLSTSLAALALLAGCFQPVGLGMPPDASAPAPADAGAALPDAGGGCNADSDCPNPPANVCAPQKAVCQSGVCDFVEVPPLWTNDPGACRTKADCDCQDLLPGDVCVGNFQCVSGRCAWTCTSRGCLNDTECSSVEICVPCGTEAYCVQGCREGTCGAGYFCDASVCNAAGCPCAAQCAPERASCASDNDCGPGSVCDFAFAGAPYRTCVPGCHDDAQCASTELCQYGMCPECANCPCHGQCAPRPTGCMSDLDCVNGELCVETGQAGSGVPCLKSCQTEVCRTSNDCPGGACVFQPAPVGPGPVCGYDHGTCAYPGSCTSDVECGAGYVCEGGQCAFGCHDSSQCPNGQACYPVTCGLYPCPGQCLPVQAGSCTADSDCPVDYVCELGTGCTTPMRCVPGCHTAAQCTKLGQICDTNIVCLTCPCPGQCIDQPSMCTDADNDGYVAQCPSPCNSKPGCDCDDHDPNVHPGAAEVCGNNLDDNCDGRVDENCPTCSSGAPACTSSFDCALGQTSCQSGCCAACTPAPHPIDCLAGYAPGPQGVDPSGCPTIDCLKTCACPALYAPVCAATLGYTATFPSSCEAQCAGFAILHPGDCLAGEGVQCSQYAAGMSCPGGQYCRDACPMCDALAERCTEIGACVWDYDCPAGLDSPYCSKGAGTWKCVSNQCQYTCP